MSKQAFDKIKEGLDEALAVARGELKPYRITNISTEMSKIANAKPLWKKQLSAHKSKVVKANKVRDK